MKQDILNHPMKVKIDPKEYTFEFDYKSLSELENQIVKGVYQIYNLLSVNEELTLEESLCLLSCGLLKHHSEEDVEELKNKIKAHPGLWLKLKQVVITSFVIPLLPPEVFKKYKDKTSKKKVK